MIKTYKVKLKPNNKQRTQLFRIANCGRFAYNWAIEREEKNFTLGYALASYEELRNEFTQIKKIPKYNYFNTVSKCVMNHAIEEAYDAFYKFSIGKRSYPKVKTWDNCKPSFYYEACTMQITETHVKVEKMTDSRKESRQGINWIRLCEKGRIPVNSKYYNPRFKYDGLDWYFTVGVNVEPEPKKNLCQGIGVDLGVERLAVCSDGTVYENINKSDKVKKIEKKIKRLKGKLENKKKINMEGENCCKTKNIAKLERKILKYQKQEVNIRDDYIHKVTTEIVRKLPEFICIENLDISGMMKDKSLSKPIQKENFKKFRRQIIYKGNLNGVAVIVADRYFPSSKRCIKCGRIKSDLKLSDRTFECSCGNVIDRDLQASINLKMYGEYILKSGYEY